MKSIEGTILISLKKALQFKFSKYCFILLNCPNAKKMSAINLKDVVRQFFTKKKHHVSRVHPFPCSNIGYGIVIGFVARACQVKKGRKLNPYFTN